MLGQEATQLGSVTIATVGVAGMYLNIVIPWGQEMNAR